MSTESVLIEGPVDGIALLTINRPEAMNALNQSVLENIERALFGLETEGDVRVLIVTGAGEKAFVAGADIAAMQEYDERRGHGFSTLGHRVFDKLANFPCPTIAAINGFALGGGLELALSCDLLFASEKAKLGLPEVTLGLLPGWGGTQRLALRVGPGKAKEMIFSGEHIKADKALAIGLVDRIAQPEKLLEEARTFAATVASRGPISIKHAKKAINRGLSEGLEAGLRYEQVAFGRCFGTKDTKEGLSAFLEKRKPAFKGQ